MPASIETKPANMTSEQRSKAIAKMKQCVKEAADVARDLNAMLVPSVAPEDKEVPKVQLNITADILLSIGQSAITHNNGLDLLGSEQLRIHNAVYQDCMDRKR